MRLVDRLSPLLGAMVLVVVVTALGSLGPASLERTVITGLINLIGVLGLQIFVGNSGVLVFSHAALMGVGGYVMAFMTISPPIKERISSGLPGPLMRAELNPVIAVVVAAAAAGVVAIVLSLALSRLSGLAAGLATVSLLVVFQVGSQNWATVTNGTSGLAPIPAAFGLWRILVWVLAVLVVAFVFQQSRNGRRLRAVREDEHAATSVGIRAHLERGIAFSISGFVLGVAGALLAQSSRAINPTSFFLTLTFLLVTMLVVGGAESIAGAVVGTIAVSVLSEVLGELETGSFYGIIDLPVRAGVREVGLALLFVLLLLRRPQGLTGGREFRLVSPTRRGVEIGNVPPADDADAYRPDDATAREATVASATNSRPRKAIP
jgi:branched-chain amino acid transport system permease protein